MKLVLAIVCLLSLLLTGCKLEASSSSPKANANAKPSQSVESSSASQEPKTNCSLTAGSAPVVENLRLGMTTDEVLANFPGSKEDSDVKAGLAKPASSLGVSEFIIYANKLQPKEKYANMSHFTFGLLDGRITSININYHGPAYAHVDEFVTKFVKGTTLPPADQWQGYPGLDTQLKTLTCKDFEVRVYAGGEGGNQNYVLLTDLEAKKTLKDRRAKARAQAKPSPTP